MHAVVVRRRGGDAEAASEEVARLLGRVPVEVKRRIAQASDEPVVIAAARDEALARAAVAVLETQGFTAGTLDVRKPFAVLVSARSFELRDDAIDVVAADKQTAAIAWGDVDAILLGVRARPEPHRPLVPVRNVLTAADALVQPLLTREEVVATPGHEQVVFVIARDRAIVLGEDRLDYRSLGAGVQPSRGANFRQVVQLVRERCPGARFDHRLERPHLRAQILGPIAALDRGLELAAAVVADDLRRDARDPYR